MKPSKPSTSMRIREKSDKENRGSEGNKMHNYMRRDLGISKMGGVVHKIAVGTHAQSNVAMVTPPMQPHLRPSLSDRC